ncbi:FkbM family methyltransferase [Cellulomonas sp. P24]|uniref:FkbM family methyltransferase n=1 Tax=Cellulomonas sp. P24 TaxID=2885206 RepID=UPI00216AF5E1|nr:FkbM family methyltransferase [Cellulomonas sp. P24]MCR6491762.1 FkbM family methyltransferase [Cellulomonas sp. P24]
MTSTPFVSYGQNAEDVVLYRALGDLPTGRYLEIGANDPTEDSISRPFYDRGWAGITVEPVRSLIDAHRRERPRDTQVHAVAGRPGVDHATLHEIPGTGLSTTIDHLRDAHRAAGLTAMDVDVRSLTVDQILEEQGPGELHFAVIDTEGAEADVLAGFDLRRWRPWVLVVEATVPNSSTPSHGEWESRVIDSGYRFCLFDGLSRFYVAEEHADDLQELLSTPANAVDNFVRFREVEARELANTLTDDVVRWRAAALSRWAEVVSEGDQERETAKTLALREELDRTHRTLSWRVTAPLRAFRRMVAR